MTRWIAYEHDEDAGWPTDAYLVVTAETQDRARDVMTTAIASQAATADRNVRSRYWAIFIEAPRALPDDDPRGDGPNADPDEIVFHGFDERRRRPPPPSPRRD